MKDTSGKQFECDIPWGNHTNKFCRWLLWGIRSSSTLNWELARIEECLLGQDLCKISECWRKIGQTISLRREWSNYRKWRMKQWMLCPLWLLCEQGNGLGGANITNEWDVLLWMYQPSIPSITWSIFFKGPTSMSKRMRSRWRWRIQKISSVVVGAQI